MEKLQKPAWPVLKNNYMQAILEIKNFNKDFRSYWTFLGKPAVKDLSISVMPGEAYGFLGHNGAGKTTTMKCILGLLKTSSGEILFNGQPLETASRSEIGYLPEQPYFYDHLTVEETLNFFADLLGIKDRGRIAEVMKELELTDRAKQKVRNLSKGWQQRLGVAQAILNKPKLLILDEPFSGLDPLGRIMLKELFHKLKNDGCTIFMSSHVLSDVSEICDRVSIMSKGKLVSILELKTWSKESANNFELVISDYNQETLSELENLAIDKKIDRQRGIVNFNSYDKACEALKLCLEHKTHIISFERKIPSLEEVFIKITEESKRTS